MQKQMRVGIYTRISTRDQSAEGQVHELKEYAKRQGWRVERIYSDTISGTTSVRPALAEMLKDAREQKFSCLVVWRVDRLGRSITHLLEVLETLRTLGIKFVSTSEAIDTASATGMMIFTILGAVAALERSILVERVQMGLANAKRRGVKLGRPALKKLDKSEISQIRKERLKGATLRHLAKVHGASVWSIFNVCSRRRRDF
jgi:DNA invertase Pin-like site-specific DNA recombinase